MVSGRPFRVVGSTMPQSDPSPLHHLTHPVIRNERELRNYVLKTCAVCVVAALAADVANQLVFFVNLTESLRSWTITMLLSGGIAYPVSRAIGKAHLDLYRTKEAFEALSRIDPLTGLLNRRALFDIARRINRPALMVLAIADIDRFKRVNDTHGHMVGDRVIRELSHVLTEEIGDLGHLCRLGGEEFALLATGIDEGVLRLRLEKARTRIALMQVVTREGVPVHVTISIGVAFAGHHSDIGTLYGEADKALYAAKKAGRNRIVFAGEGADEANAGARTVSSV